MATLTKKGIATKIVVGGVSGIVLGASSMATAGNAIINDIAEDVQGSGANYEELSFGEAFAAAREDLGPGETFEWHGNVYSTYTAEEWDAAHPSEPAIEPAAEDIDADAAEIMNNDVESGAVDSAEEEVSPNEVEILGEEDGEEDIEVEMETGNDINGDEAAFVDLEEDIQTDAVEDVYVGQEVDSVCDTSDYSNDDTPMV